MSKEKLQLALLFIGPALPLIMALMLIFFIFAGSGLFGKGMGADDSSFGTEGGDLANANAITCEQLKDLLENKLMPTSRNLRDYSQQICDSVQRFHVNPLLSLAIANKDSSMGTAGENSGLTCRNPGNMEYRDHKFAASGATSLGRCGDIYGGSNRWAAFSTYGDGMQAKIWLLRTNYLDKGLTTVDAIINKYCPPSDCVTGDPSGTQRYIEEVKAMMAEWSGYYN